MNTLKITFIVALLSCSCLTQAQSPGYIGKKISIGYNFKTMAFPNFLLGIESYTSVAVNTSHQLELEYAIGRNVSIGLDIDYTPYKLYLEDESAHTNSGYNSQGSRLLIPKDQYHNSNSIAYQFSLKFFTRNFIAPIGIYHKISIGNASFNLKEKVVYAAVTHPDIYYDYSNTNGVHSHEEVVYESKKRHNAMLLSYAIGSKKIIKNNIFFQGGVQFSYLFSTSNDPYTSKTSSTPSSRFDPIERDLMLTLRYKKLMEIFFGVGILL